jgi:hypothetical protein
LISTKNRITPLKEKLTFVAPLKEADKSSDGTPKPFRKFPRISRPTLKLTSRVFVPEMTGMVDCSTWGLVKGVGLVKRGMMAPRNEVVSPDTATITKGSIRDSGTATMLA